MLLLGFSVVGTSCLPSPLWFVLVPQVSLAFHDLESLEEKQQVSCRLSPNLVWRFSHDFSGVAAFKWPS